MDEHALARPWTAVAAVLLAAVVAVAVVAWSVSHGSLVDVALLRSVARAALGGRSPYDVVAEVPFVYPPGGIVVAMLAMVGSTLRATAVWWDVVSCLALARAVWLLARAAWPDLGTTSAVRRAALLTAAALLLEPTLVGLGFGQVGLLLLWLTVEGSPRTGSPAARTALVGAAAAVKLTPAVVLLGLAAAGRWGPVAWGLLGAVVTTAVGVALSPSGAADLLHGAWRLPFDVNSGPDVLNQSVPGSLSALGLPTVVGLALGAAVLCWGVALAARSWRRGDDLEALATALVAGLLASPVSWSHHWVAAYPALVLLLRDARRHRSATVLLVAALVGWAARLDLVGVGDVRTVVASGGAALMLLHAWPVLWGLGYLAVAGARDRSGRRAILTT